jgi:hypothetical protein
MPPRIVAKSEVPLLRSNFESWARGVFITGQISSLHDGTAIDVQSPVQCDNSSPTMQIYVLHLLEKPSTSRRASSTGKSPEFLTFNELL